MGKSIMEAIPMYSMMAAKIPQSCLTEIQKIQQNFIWGESDQKRKWHAVRWDTVTQPKHMGGFGLRMLKHMNQTCMMKLG